MPKFAPKQSELKKEFEEKPSLLKGDYPDKELFDTPVEFRDGNWCYPAKPENYLTGGKKPSRMA